MADLGLTITILDLPEIEEVLREAIDAVPAWERAELQRRLEEILARAREARAAATRKGGGWR